MSNNYTENPNGWGNLVPRALRVRSHSSGNAEGPGDEVAVLYGNCARVDWLAIRKVMGEGPPKKIRADRRVKNKCLLLTISGRKHIVQRVSHRKNLAQEMDKKKRHAS